jgi:hypothetical protein
MISYANQIRGNSDLRVMHYMLSDGEPNGRETEIRNIKRFLRAINVTNDSITFMGCSNDRTQYRWMHEMEILVRQGIATLPDYPDELSDVQNDQGSAFPYTRGLWLICNLVAAINPNDLDALDHGAPLTKPTLEYLLGRGMVEAEYSRYFYGHPGGAGQVFGPDYEAFKTTLFASQIPSVGVYNDNMQKDLDIDIEGGNDDSEQRDDYLAKEAVMAWRRMNAYQQAPTMYGTSNSGAMYQQTPTMQQYQTPTVYTASNPNTMYQQAQRPIPAYNPLPPSNTCCTIS